MKVYNAKTKKWEEKDQQKPIATQNSTQKRTWFQSGLFEDGYQFGDVAKTILGTATDLGSDVGGGFLEIGEKIIDAGAYVAGGVGDLFGADDFAKDTKEFIKKDLYDGEKIASKTLAAPSKLLLKALGEDDYEAASVLGDRIDSLAQSGGQLLGTVALQSVGVPWFLTSGVTGFGSAVEESFKEDASYGKAGVYGLVSAGAEILTEKLFGGSGLGEKGLINLQPLTKGIANKAVKVLADFGVDMAAEGTEEVISSVFNRLGSSLYKEENLKELLFSEEALDEYLESFIGGAALGGMMNASNMSHSVKQKTDYRTGITAAEQSVFDKVYEERLFEEEKTAGKSLSSKEKAKIFDETLEDLKKGGFSIDTIEEVLGGDSFKSYKEVLSGEEAVIREYDELANIPENQLTRNQKKRLDELEEKIDSARDHADSKKTKNDFDGYIKDLIKNDSAALKGRSSYLEESYNERGRRGEKFSASLSEYRPGQRETVQKAIDSGVLNNTNRTREMVSLVAKLAEEKGISFDFVNNQKLKETGFALEGKTVDGFVTNGNITLNVNSAKTLNTVVGHEIAHVLEGTELYSSLQESITRYAKEKGDYDKKLQTVSELYKDVKDANIEGEVTADLIGEYLFSDKDFVNRLSTENRNVFQKIFDEIKYLCKAATAGSKEARELEKIRHTFEEVYRSAPHASTAQKNTADSGARYSLSDVKIPTTEDLEKKSPLNVVDISKAQTEGFYRDRRRAIMQNVDEVISKPYLNKDTNTMIFLTKQSYTHAFNNLGDIQLNAAEHLPELIEEAVLTHSEKTTHGNEFADGIYTFFAAVKNGTTIQPVKLKVKEYSYQGQDLPKNIKKYFENSPQDYAASYDTVVLQVDEIQESSSGSAKDMNQEDSFLGPDELSTISVADLLNLVKGDAEKYLPKLSLSSAEDLAPVRGIRGKDVALDPAAKAQQEEAKTKKSSKEGDIAPFFTPAESKGRSSLLPDDYAPLPESVKNKGKTEDSGAEEVVEDNSIKGKNRARLKKYESDLASLTETRNTTLEMYDNRLEELALRNAKANSAAEKESIRKEQESISSMREQTAAFYEKQINELNGKISKMNSKSFKRVEQRITKDEERKAILDDLVGDTTHWKDKKLGFSYQINTLRRNLRDIVRNERGERDLAKADRIWDFLQGKYNEHEADMNRESNRIKEAYAKEKITSAEDVYIQMLGEFRHNPDTTLKKEDVEKFYEKNKDQIDTEKVDRLIGEARKTYDELLSRVNEALREQGMKEIPYRQGYFPHFTEDKQSFLGKLLNWKTKNNEIPTDIAGLTETFKPKRSWQAFDKQRKGDTTDYSFTKGLDTYVRGALDWIYHIDDIQNRRAFEDHIRFIHSDKGVQEKIKEIIYDEDLSEEDKRSRIDAIHAEAANPLNNFVTDFRTSTNILAGKKSSMDRGAEAMTNRKIYSVMTNLSNRVNANMVGGSISSALTNFIPITQSWGEVSPLYSLKAMGETVRSIAKDDGTIDKSAFLTNRLRKAENLNKTGWDKVSEKIGFMMEAVDWFTSQTVWRSKYLQNISNNMSEAEAIKNADQFAENVIAGRSRGNQPTIFESKNPLLKMFTAFQLEVNNQSGYMFKDMPQEILSKEEGNTSADKAKARGRLLLGYASMFAGAYAYNALFSSLTGRDAVFDPVGIVEDLLRDLGLLGEDEEEEPADALLNLTDNVLEEIPFISGLVGGGRIPISSALPYGEGVYEMFSGTVEDISEGNVEKLTKEWLNPVYYLLPPAGGGGQLKKTVAGLSMFDETHPTSGSYTDSGDLRFPVEDTPWNRLQAALFGQWASKNANEYFDGNKTPLSPEQVQEFLSLDITIQEYWKYREGLKGLSTMSEKADYIAGLSLPTEKKNILINNISDRSEPIDLTDYDLYDSFEEFDYATKYPEKYAVAKAIGGIENYRKYSKELAAITADKNKVGNAIPGSRKRKVAAYINSLDADYGTKLILFRSQFPSDHRYNRKIVDYLNDKEGLSFDDVATVLKALDFTVLSDGTVKW